MSAGPSLYRRHRPRTFADVVGQEHVVRTLSHAVEGGNVHHAYLFVGSRGTGKTSMAKILAACLNCENGPTVSPCGTCDSCVSIAGATSLDVIEMDAASNNSVDDIRELREKVAYAPVSGRHKVYILDEAHMLSQQAWNAFLKTLEEPPPRTIFVLATTEAQKVLPTVVDRCHRFDFGRPTAEQVASVVRRVSASESIDIDPGAVALIARHATGSFRDALGTLEQLVTYAGDERIGPADVLAVLGVADSEQLFGAVQAVIARDPAEALRAAAQLAASGRDPGQVLRDLEIHARELLTVRVLGEVPAELRVTAERDQRLAEQAAAISETDTVRLLDLVSAALEATANGAQPRIQLELVLIKAAAPEVDPSVAALQARIERLEAGVAAAPPARVHAPAEAPAPAASENAPEPEPGPAPAEAPPQPAAAGPARPAADEAPPASGDLAAIAALWPAVVDTVRGANAMLAALLQGARPVAVNERELTVAFSPEAAFMKRKAEQDDYRRAAAEALRNVTGQALLLRYELAEAEGAADAPVAVAEAPLSDEELIARFVQELDAQEIHEPDAGDDV
ncbi:MAG TPA: DNA polymerase III subunit gamma/tau [Solirubrobacteraceae bacterium]|nr:DNA polymerase III subunit gamma/tau [Solirubrobacteraceae bacterium]